MNKSTNSLDGSPGFSFETKKSPEGKWTATPSSHPEFVFEGDDEIDAIRTANAGMRDKVLKGEL
jgi:hypothetical protein